MPKASEDVYKCLVSLVSSFKILAKFIIFSSCKIINSRKMSNEDAVDTQALFSFDDQVDGEKR